MGSAIRLTSAALAATLVVGMCTVTAQQSPGKWVTNKYAPLPEPAEEYTHAVVNNKLYLMGGNSAVFTPGGRSMHPARVLEYDLATDKWTQKKQMPVFSDHMSAAGLNGKIYVVGGTGAMRQEDPNLTLDLAWEYDIAADKWNPIAKLNAKRTAGAAVELGGKIYFIGGTTDLPNPAGGPPQNAGLVVGTNESYDPATNRWETHKPMPTPRNHPAIGVVGGKIYVIGGRVG